LREAFEEAFFDEDDFFPVEVRDVDFFEDSFLDEAVEAAA
jgi:hypothetical protein